MSSSIDVKEINENISGTHDASKQERWNNIWWKPIQAIPAATRAVLEEYSHIPPDDVLSHVQKVQRRAYEIHPWPCIGVAMFLPFDMRTMPEYPQILSRLKDGDTFLDVGCGLGQELRGLAAEGVPARRLFGIDYEAQMLESGFELFRDEETFKSQVKKVDILGSDSDYSAFEKQVDIANCAYFLMLFDYDDQVVAAKRVVSFLRPKKGSMIVGRQMGVKGQPLQTDGMVGKKTYWHTEESLRKFWTDLAGQLGVEWASLDVSERSFPEDWEMGKRAGDGWIQLRFTIQLA